MQKRADILKKSYSFMQKRAQKRAVGGGTAALCLFFFLLYSCDTLTPVRRTPFPIRVTADSTVAIYDTLKIKVSVAEDGIWGVSYAWFIDSPLLSDTTSDTILKMVFSVADTGNHWIVIKAIDRNSLESLPDSIRIRVVFHRPAVTILADTAAPVHVVYPLRFSGTDGSSCIDHFNWYIDDPLKRKMTRDTLITLVWGIADTGRHVITVLAVDRDGIASSPSSIPVRVSCSYPSLQPLRDTAVKVNSTLMLSLFADDPVSWIDKYFYAMDNSPLWDTVNSNTLKTEWHVADTGRHVFIVKAMNADSAQSQPDTSIITVTYGRPSVRLYADSAVTIHDTVTCLAMANDTDGTVDHYRWSIDGTGTAWFTTRSDTLLWLFGGKAESFHCIRVNAVDNDGFVSRTDSVMVHVRLERPSASLVPDDTTVVAGQNLRLTAAAFDTNGTIAEYRWMLDGRLLLPSLTSDTVTLRWGPAEAGMHLISITVVDNDSLASPPDSVRVTVLPGTPVIRPTRDTALSSSDTLTVVCHAADSNGTIVRYLWNFSGAGRWDDSTADSLHRLFYGGKGIVNAVAGVRDNDGLIAADTFTVTFNRPPDSVIVGFPVPGDTIILPQSTPLCTVSFAYSAIDPDDDTVVYSLFWGPASDSLSLVYQGTDQSSQAAGVCPGHYFWRLEARDSWGHVRTDSGTVTVLREYRICFIGHSIVAGMGGDSIVGGFRGGVLDSLRKTLNPFERLKTVGPCVSVFMRRSAADDSSYAIISSTGPEIFRALTVISPQLTADMWVLMTGVNNAYRPSELSYITGLMDVMRSRNPDSRIYVLNGNLVTSNFWEHNYWLPYFNQGITDAIAQRVAAGAHIFQVDAYTALSYLASDSTRQYDSTLFYFGDGLGIHPNQAGYDRLRDAIFSTMKNSIPAVFLQKPEPYSAYRP